MRPKFTLANLLLFTAIVAMGAQMYRLHLRSQELEAELALHKAVRAQTYRVRQRELKLQAAMHQSKPQLQVAAMYQWGGHGDQLLVNSAGARPSGMELTLPIGIRRTVTHARNAELQLLRERDLLQRLEHDLSRRPLRHGGR